MMTRLRAWREETHGAGFELVRHFLARFFGSEMVSTPEVYLRRYNYVESPGFLSAETCHQWIRANMPAFIAVAMAVTALLTLLQWQSLFSSAQECLALAGLPVNRTGSAFGPSYSF